MGAWQQPYRFGLAAPAGSNLGDAIVAVKRELAYTGHAAGLVLDTPVFGDAARRRAIDFQAAQGLTADGVIGPATARALFRNRARAVQNAHAIPEDILCRIKTLESANDPAAVGYSDPDDHGLVQINLRLHTNVSLAEAVDPAFALPWAGGYLDNAHDQLHDWDAAIASYNVGVGGAHAWLVAGKPTTGGTASAPDLYARAARYVALVEAQSV